MGMNLIRQEENFEKQQASVGSLRSKTEPKNHAEDTSYGSPAYAFA